MDFYGQLALLAVSAFTSATILPGTSEAAMAALTAAYPQHWAALWLTAGAANTAGSLVTYAMGRLWPLSHKISRKARARLQRFGAWSLLLAWLPVAGDALCLAAGSLKLPLLPSAAALLVGKMLRYALIAAAVFQTA